MLMQMERRSVKENVSKSSRFLTFITPDRISFKTNQVGVETVFLRQTLTISGADGDKYFIEADLCATNQQFSLENFELAQKLLTMKMMLSQKSS